jgi:hypothetical protein
MVVGRHDAHARPPNLATRELTLFDLIEQARAIRGLIERADYAPSTSARRVVHCADKEVPREGVHIYAPAPHGSY